MAFWALGALDKVKNMTQKLNIKDMGKKVINYVATQHINHNEQKIDKNDFFPPQKTKQTDSKQTKTLASNQSKMEIQLREYKKLIKMQERILQQSKKRQKQELSQKQAKLQQMNAQLIQRQRRQKYEFDRANIVIKIESGQKNLEDLIEENIKMKEEIYHARKK